MPVAELKARTACGDLLPVTHGSAQLVELDLGIVTSVALLGDEKAMSEAMDAVHGVGFPKPNRTTGKSPLGKGGVCSVWIGRNQALLIGVAPDASLRAHGALVDQSDGWCAVCLSGAAAEDVLARLVPIDLRAGHFKRGHTARTLLGHMTVSITRTEPEEFMILVFRSMASTLVHELSAAMLGVASRTS